MKQVQLTGLENENRREAIKHSILRQDDSDKNSHSIMKKKQKNIRQTGHVEQIETVLQKSNDGGG